MADAVLDAGVLQFLQRRVMVSAASCSAEHFPSVVRCVGFRILERPQRLVVFVRTSETARLLADLHATRRVAVVFSEPTTHRTLQVKGDDALPGPLEHDDWPHVAAHVEAAVAELAPLGYPEIWVRKVFESAQNQVQAVRFTPTSAFAQTPGPRAGEPLAGAQP